MLILVFKYFLNVQFFLLLFKLLCLLRKKKLLNYISFIMLNICLFELITRDPILESFIVLSIIIFSDTY